jgi:hypothetical protein
LADDKVDGEKVPDGGRSRKLAVGPKAVFWFSPRAALVIQYHREMQAENGPEGNLTWIEFTFPL